MTSAAGWRTENFSPVDLLSPIVWTLQQREPEMTLSCCSLSTMISIFLFFFSFGHIFGSQSVNSVLKCFETTSVHLIIPTLFFFSASLSMERHLKLKLELEFPRSGSNLAGVKMLPLSGLEHSSQRHCPVYVCIRH